MTLLFAILGSIALIAAIEGARHAARFFSERRRTQLQHRLQSLGRPVEEGHDLLRRGRFAQTGWVDAALRAFAPARAMEQLLEQASSTLTVAQLVGVSAGMGGIALVALLGVGRTPLLVLAGTFAAAGAPFAWLILVRDRRSRRMSEQLPEALAMMARSLRAGHALTTSFQVVATEMPEPISLEFARAFEEQRLGLPFEQAVMSMLSRAPKNGDLKIFAVSTVIQKETGGNLAEILDNIAATIRDRYRFYGKLRALTAEGRASGLILGLLPFLVAVFMSFLNPEYLVPLVETPQGHAILAYAVVSWALGLAWMMRLTRLEI
jgi:tight adherence protein B